MCFGGLARGWRRLSFLVTGKLHWIGCEIEIVFSVAVADGVILRMIFVQDGGGGKILKMTGFLKKCFASYLGIQ